MMLPEYTAPKDLRPNIWISENPETKEISVKNSITESITRSKFSLWEGASSLVSSISRTSQEIFDPQGRLLLLEGEKGTVACRVSGPLSRTLPRLSEDWTLEFATRTFLRMSNLIAIRGIPGSSMVGPCDYFGNLGQLDKFLYTFDVTEFPPVIQRIAIAQNEKINPVLQKFDDTFITTVRANWISGNETEIIQEKKVEYDLKAQHLRQSLFLNPGLLEIEASQIELKYFNPRYVDLSSFKARLVENTVPFRISEKPLPSKDDYRLVTYRYEAGYAGWQVEEGSGLFLEKHNFSQNMTPLTPDSKGFVTLARLNDHPNELEMIGIQIPFGFTLIIEEGCIHGDTTLNGFFMMGMTSDHTTMRTADTVFLKDHTTKKNVAMFMDQEEGFALSDGPVPYVLFANASDDDKEKFKRQTENKSFICTPQTSAYWK